MTDRRQIAVGCIAVWAVLTLAVRGEAYALDAAHEPLSLTACVERAAERAPSVVVERERVVLAEARYDDLFWRRFPNVTLTTLFSFAPGSGGDATEASGDLFANWGPVVRLEARAEMPLYTFGRLSAEEDAARRRVDAARARVLQAIADVTAKVRRAWHDRAAAHARAAILRRGLAEIAKISARLRALEDEDDADFDPVDLLKVRVRKVDADLRLREAQREEARAKAILRAQLALPPGARLDLEAPTVTPIAQSVAPLDEVLAIASTFNPALRRRRIELDAMRDDVRAQSRGLFPEIFLAGSFWFHYAQAYDSQLSPFAEDGDNGWRIVVAVGLRLPLGIPQRLARRSEARAELAYLVRDRALRRSLVRMEVGTIHRELSDALRLLPSKHEAARAARAWYSAASDVYELGIGSLSDSLKALTQLIDREIAVVDAVHDVNIDVVALSRATGVDAMRLIGDRQSLPGPGSRPGVGLRGGELPKDLPPELLDRIRKRLGLSPSL